ncbi:MAG: YHS domain-containing protein, partial [Ghiorsea sp.]|nr:YHS domain-containing protein [Ghiorsea sp.]
MTMKTCPVCNMQVNAKPYVSQHHGIDYWFCSTPCQQTFLARPRLYLRPVKKVLLKTRVFRLQADIPEAQQEEVQQKLMRWMGVRSVSFKHKRVIITYNLL